MGASGGFFEFLIRFDFGLVYWLRYGSIVSFLFRVQFT